MIYSILANARFKTNIEFTACVELTVLLLLPILVFILSQRICASDSCDCIEKGSVTRCTDQESPTNFLMFPDMCN